MNKSGLALSLPLIVSLFLAPLPVIAQSGPPPVPPLPVRALGFYPLETPPWGDWFDYPARGFANLNVAWGWDYNGTALSVDTNVPAYLNYDVFQYGDSIMPFDSGSLSLWVQPNWTSVSDGGLGPTNWATLLSVGQWTSNATESAWTIAVAPSGDTLVMEAQSNGLHQVVFRVPITYDAGDWHSVVITYSLTNCGVYLEGQLATNAPPISYYPTVADCTNFGFFVGSISSAGMGQFHGQLEWLASYDYPLDSNEVASSYADLSSFISYFGGSLPGSGLFHSAADSDGPPDPGGGGTNDGGGGTYSSSPMVFNDDYTNGLYLLMDSVAGGTAFVELDNASNQVYGIYSSTDLVSWIPETEVFPTNQQINPFTVSQLNRANLFLSAMDWTSYTVNGLPAWWTFEYFDSLNHSSTNLDSSGLDTLLLDYDFGMDPNIVQFTVSMSNQYVSSAVAPIQIAVKHPATLADVERIAQSGVPTARLHTALQKEGFDGVFDKQKGMVIAFHPTQIKSAIGNKGTFNPKDASITNAAPPVITETFDDASRALLARHIHADLAPAAPMVIEFLNALAQIEDEALKKQKADEFMSKWAGITGDILMAPSSADALARIVGSSYADGLRPAAAGMTNENPNHDAQGRFASADSIKAVVAHGLTRNTKSWFNYATVQNSVASKVASDGGPNVQGHTHRIEADAVRKILRDHGSDPLPITKEDFEKLPEIVGSPDRVSFSPDTTRSTNLPAVQYEKRYNGTTVVVEEVRKGHGRLALKTMYKRPS